MKPILFNTEMVRAIQNGTKAATRRVVKPQPAGEIELQNGLDFLWIWDKGRNEYIKAAYCPGDILYVRETWSRNIHGDYVYRTDYGTTEDDTFPPSMFKWRPSIHMPREAARIFLRVTGVRVERLQRITPEQLRAEGMRLFATPSECKRMFDRFGAVKDFEHKRSEFADIWDSTIKKADRALYGWKANPWVWVVEFEQIGREEATKGGS